MRFEMRVLGLVAAASMCAGLVFVACDDGEEYEGDAAGECDDGADNDRDGRFDCDDEGCAASPICGGGDGDADGDGDGDADGDADGDGDGDGDGDCDADVGRRVGELTLAHVYFESEESLRTTANASFRRDSGISGCNVQRFGECSVASLAQPSCEPACENGGSCVWGEGCTPTCQGYNPAEMAVCTPECERGQTCVWSGDLSSTSCYGDAALTAGPITVTGGSNQPNVPGTPSLEIPGTYTWELDTEAAWFAFGDSLHVEAVGDGFPAFSADVPAPADVEVGTDFDGWASSTIDGSADAQVRWTAGEGGESRIMIIVQPNYASPLTCITADDGSFDIPAAALSAMGLNGSWEVGVSVSRLNTVVLDECADGEATISVASSVAWRVSL